MSQFGNISISYHPLDITNNNTYLKWYKSKKFLFICILSVLTIFAVGVILFKKLKNDKEKLINSTIITNLTLTSKSSVTTTTTENVGTISLSTCHRPLYPIYNKFGTIVTGITSTLDIFTKHLDSPSCVYLDSKKNVYICDINNNRIMKYSPDNPKEGITIIDSLSNLNHPQSLYIDKRNDDLYFLDWDDEKYYRIQYLPKNSTQKKGIILFIGNQCQSHGMTLDHNRNIYVSEMDNHRVVKWLSPKYDDFIVVAGSNRQGTQSNELSNPRGIYLNPVNNDLYVVDSYRIQLWPAESTIGQTVTPTYFQSISSITGDCHGNLYVIDIDVGTICLFSQSIEDTGVEGLIIIGVPYPHGWMKGYTNTAGRLITPLGLYLDDETGDLYVADSGYNGILKMSINGSFIPVKRINTSVHTCDLPMNISWEANGTIVAENLITEYCTLNDTNGCSPKDIYFDKQNNLFVIETANNRIQKYTSSDVITVASQGLNRPQSIYVDSSTDDMYILDFGLNDIIIWGHHETTYRVQLWHNNSIRGITIINGTDRSYCMNVDQALNIYTAEYDNSRIRKWLAHTNYTISITVYVDGWYHNGNNGITGLRYFYLDDETDILYIVNSYTYNIVKWKLSNNTKTGEIIFSEANVWHSNRPWYSNRITLDCKKNIYFIHPSYNELYRIDASTNQLSKVFVDDNNKTKHIFQNTVGIKFDSFGNLFLLDNEYNRITKFSIIR